MLTEIRLPLQQVPRSILRSIVQDAQYPGTELPRLVILGIKVPSNILNHWPFGVEQP